MSEPAPEHSDDMASPAQLQALLKRVLDSARRHGATAAEAGADASRALTVRVRRGETEAVEFQADRGLQITAFHDHSQGSASTTDWSDKAVETAVARACAIARHTGADPYAGLADAGRMARDFPELELAHSWALSVDAATALAAETEAAALAVDARIDNSDGAEVDSRTGISAYANSHGFFGCQRASNHGFSCAVIARDGDAMQRDYWYSVARDPADLDAAEAVGRRAGERTIARLGAITPATTTAPVLFPARMARSLFGHFLGAISGGALYRDASFLKDRVGEQIFAPGVSMTQQPHLRKAMGSAAFDAEGVATEQRDLVTDGVLQGYLLGSYAGRRLGLESTGNAGGVFNPSVAAGEHDFADLLRQMGDGLLVNELMGHGVNLITGDYSRGASGFWVEGGEIAYPVENITIAGNLCDIYANITALGNDVDTRANLRTPSVLVEAMMVAGS